MTTVPQLDPPPVPPPSPAEVAAESRTRRRLLARNVASLPPPQARRCSRSRSSCFLCHRRALRAGDRRHQADRLQIQRRTSTFPFLGYFIAQLGEPDLHQRSLPRHLRHERSRQKDPESWAIWPLVYQDPYRRVRDDEWPGQPGNPVGTDGRPSRINWFGTNQQGFDVFAQMVHGTQIALIVGFVSMGIAAAIGITLGALAGYFGGWVDMLISRIIEVVMCIPTLVLILALVAMLDHVTNCHLMAIIGSPAGPASPGSPAPSS